jgi:preprotein translocase subunit SecB
METKPSKAAFRLTDFKFPFLTMDLSKAPDGEEIDIDFKASGIFHKTTQVFDLAIVFFAFADENDGKKPPFINVSLIAEFTFDNVTSKENIPEYFYKNSIAIVYPYIRSIVSTLSLQSNHGTLILPTMNLSMLGDTLVENTTED